MASPALLIAALLSGEPAEDGFAYPPVERDGVSARLKVRVEDPGDDPPAARVLLAVTLEGPAALEATARLDDADAAWQATASSSVAQSEERATWQIVFALRQVKPGAAPLPAVRARFRAGPERAWQEAVWTDLLKTQQPAPGPALVEPPRAPSGRPVLLAAAVALVAGLLLLMWRLRGRRKTAPPLSASARASQALDRLELAPGDPAAFHQELGDVVRGYAAEVFGVPALRRTTQEFLAQLAATTPAPRLALLAPLLQRCDLGKFARRSASADERRELLTAARQVIAESANSPAEARAV